MNANEIANAIIAGTATENEQGIALRALQTALSSQLIKGMDSIMSSVISLNSILQMASAKIEDRVEADLELMNTNQLLELIDGIQSKQIQVLDLLRKIVQGKELFPQETLSEEERKILRLVNSFSSPDQKQKFLDLVNSELSKVESVQDFDE